jgi:HlyD family secretion protein
MALAGAALLSAALGAGCATSGGGGAPVAHYRVARAEPGRITRALRIGGSTEATHAFTLRIPQIPGQSDQFVLVSIVPNGTRVRPGQVLAQFDDTAEAQNALDAQAKYDDLVHQVADTRAQNRANAAQRASNLKQAEADLGKARLELQKAPILSAIDAATDRLNLADASAHVADLTLENADQARADAAALRILQLKRDQQKVEWERAQAAVEALTLRAPLAGMVGLLPVFRANSEGPAQPGDQLYSGTSLLQIFNRSDMLVSAQVNQADAATLTPGLRGTLRLDAYPDLKLPVHFLSVGPMAVAGGLGVPTRMFAVLFHVDGHDPRLFPGLTAAIDLRLTSARPELLIPRPALRFAGARPYVVARQNGGAWRRVAVELGNFNARQVGILSGLSAGAEVRAPAMAAEGR